MFKKYLLNPFIVFFPFLIIYIILIFLFPTNGEDGDQARYLIYSKYMISGNLPINQEFELLGNGPGYSILLIPFILLKLPFLSITLLNAVFYYLSIVIIFKALKQITTSKKSLIICIFWGFYYNLYEHIIIIGPEILITFLITLLIYIISKSLPINNKPKGIHIILSGLIIGYIALIKPIFGYVLMTIIFFAFFYFLINKKSTQLKNLFAILFIALITTLPYLLFTFNKSGKLFYWSSLGGNNMYWMSTPYKNEYGDWFKDPNRITVYGVKSDQIPGSGDSLVKNHQENFDYILQFDGIKRDEAYKRITFLNIQNNPIKYIKNILANAGRIVFNFPFSYSIQKPTTLLRIPLNGILIVLSIFSLYISLIKWHSLPFYLRFLLIFVLIYLGGSLLGSAETRMFSIIVPVLLYWNTYVFQRSLKIKTDW